MEKREDIIEEVIELPEENDVCSINISPDVIATIAGVATSEINGVAGMCNTFASGIAEIFGQKKNASKGIKVELKENAAIIDLYVIVDYGIRIPELAWEIQESVKNNVETMTGFSVEKVNIHIDGISFKKAEEAEKKANSSQEDFDEIIVEESEIEELPTEEELQV